jgi:molybdopterin molybdotransferase
MLIARADASAAGMMAFPEAQRLIVAACSPCGVEAVTLEAAAGRVLAVDAVAREMLVPFARSAMDGYAVATADLVSLPLRLPVVAGAYAAPGEVTHVRGTATAVATGAALPIGADAVLPFEDVEIEGDAIFVGAPVEPGNAIFPPGDDARAGDVLVRRGATLGPAALGILAAAGYARVDVYRRPVVTIVCGGDELVPVDRTPGFGQVRNSNASMLAAAVTALGGHVRAVATVPDDRDELLSALREALDASDLVISTGGASRGERDYVKEAAKELGVEFAFERVALRPAKPSAFGVRPRLGDPAGESEKKSGRGRVAALVVLPGNPAAAFAGFHLLARPALRALAGADDPLPPEIVATLDGEIRSKPERHFAAFAELLATDNGLVARPLENQCSSLTRTAAEACGFILVPPGERTWSSGDSVRFVVVDWSQLRHEAAARRS